MAYRLLVPSAAALGAGLAYHTATRQPMLFRPTTYHCDTPVASMLPSFKMPWVKHEAPKPREHSTFDPTIYRQVSSGSFFGVALGLFVARFGKVITILVGALMILAERMAGLNMLPAGSTLQRWVKNTDIEGFLSRNPAFKAAFGASFLVAAIYCK